MAPHRLPVDRIYAGNGADTVFGDDGDDFVAAGRGDDRIFGGAGNDTLRGAAGDDWIETGAGRNVVAAGAGNDMIFGGDERDVIRGGAGADVISAALGDDRMIGGKGSDVYRIAYDRDALAPADAWGHDVVRDAGDALPAVPAPFSGIYGDTLEFFGLYGPPSGYLAEGIARLRAERIGDDMLIETVDGLSSVRVEKQFAAANGAFAMESVKFNAGYWADVYFRVVDSDHVATGDDRGGAARLNEFLFGSEGDDSIFSDSGSDLIWTGAGADTLIYKESDPELLYDLDGNRISSGHVIDTVMDFDIASDRLDFTEIKGLAFADLALSEDAEGDARIAWDAGDIAIADIYIELRGVALAEVTEALFLFA